MKILQGILWKPKREWIRNDQIIETLNKEELITNLEKNSLHTSKVGRRENTKMNAKLEH